MKSIEEIYQQMMEVYARRTGYRPADGCDLAVRLYAMAAQVQALTAQAEWVMGQVFPQTATGEYLDRHAAGRGLQRQEATAAEGMIEFLAPGAAAFDLPIPKGTVCLTVGGQRFETVEDGVIAAGQEQAAVAARAVEPGRGGNVPGGSIVLMSAAPPGVSGCGNSAPFTGGSDGEDDESLRSRILESFRRLPNGANAAFYEQIARQHDGVASAKAVGRARGIGTVDVYVVAADGVPDEALLEEIRADLQEKREIAVDVQVLPPAVRTVDVEARITPAEGVSPEAAVLAVETALRGFFTGALLERGVKVADLAQLLYSLDEVDNYVIVAPAADVPGEAGVLPVLGSAALQAEV